MDWRDRWRWRVGAIVGNRWNIRVRGAVGVDREMDVGGTPRVIIGVRAIVGVGVPVGGVGGFSGGIGGW